MNHHRDTQAFSTKGENRRYPGNLGEDAEVKRKGSSAKNTYRMDDQLSNLITCISTASRTELLSQRLLHMWTSPSRLRIGRAPRKKTQP
ncbi:hypothetical protein DMN91_010598 [Ooceraea biroi]|uniref:Uncharacterized protein n=1 Tax=Ooceraea biroi TaxID=2015173 RepID=A0A3L8D7S4_OOCBI|nr:hypothetical protein DMN91_010598 [Ooceraea biroi]